MPTPNSVTLLLGLLLGACATPAAAPDAAPAAPPLFELAYAPVDEASARALEPVLAEAVARVERFFGAPFVHPFRVVVHPDRAAFDASFPPEWGLGRSECWMVASGVADGVQLLSPRAWSAEACEHDAADARHVQDLVTHELVHTFHGQHNPSPDFVDVTGIDWFVEGLAVLASGQLADEKLLSARDAVASGAGPTELARAWSGKHRYGVSGSLVAFLEHELGRAKLMELLGATSGEELLAEIGLSESELLMRWESWLLFADSEL